MAKRDSHWELNIQTGIEVQQASFNRAAKIFDNFYNKYNDQKIQIDTSDLVKTVRDGVSELQKLYKEGTMDSSGWLQLRPELKSSFEQILSDAEEMFRGIKVLFNDGSYVDGFENILRGFNNQLSVVFSDIGGLYDELRLKQKSLFDELGDIGMRSHFDKSDIYERIDALRELIDIQSKMSSINPSLKSKDFASGYNTDQLVERLKNHQKVLEEMAQYELETVDQIMRRRRLLDDVSYVPYDSDSQYYTKEDKDYDRSIANLTEYIQEKQDLIQKLKEEESELFHIDGIEQHIATLRGQIEMFETFKKELEGLRGDGNDGPVNIDFSEVVNQLKEIKDVVNQIKTAFEPLTDAFADGESALSKMLKTSVDDLIAMEGKLSEVYQMIDAISNKQFNVTNVISNGGGTQGDVELIRQYRAEARELLKVVEELYGESSTTANKIKGTPDGFEAFLNFSNTMGDFDFADLSKRIKSRSATSLGVVIDELNEWKKVLLQFNNLRNNVEAGSFNVSKYNSTSSRVNVGTKTADVEQKEIVDKDSVNNDDILRQVKTLGEQIEAEFSGIRSKIESTFDFSTIDPKLDGIRNITDTIYHQFVELKTKIDALDLSLNIPAVTVVGTDTASADGIKKAADAIQEEGNAAEDATIKKDKFVAANKEVANSGDTTKAGIQEATDAIEEEGKAAEKAADQISNALKRIDQSVGNKPLTINGTSYEDFQNFAMTLAASNNMKIDDVSVVSDGDDNAKLATIKMVNEELAQSVVYTYRLSDAEGTIVNAYLERYKASSNVNKALKKQLAEQKRLDKERAQNNQFLIKQQEALDAQERRYKHSKKTVDGSTSLMSTETSLGADAEQTIDSLTKHIRERIKSAIGGSLTEDLREEILNDIRILKNEISIAQNDKYSATTMKASSVKTNVKAYKEYLNAFEANAKKGNVFDKIKDDIKSLREELDNVQDSPALDAFIDNLKVARNKLTAEKAKYSQEAAENKQSEQQYNNIIKLQDKLYDAKKRLAQVDAGSAKGLEQSRKVKEIQEEYEAALKLLQNAEDQTAIQERQIELEKELAAVRLQSQNSYGKTIYNRESRYFDTIAANKSSMGDSTLSADFLNKISEYESAYQRLKILREDIINNPLASSSPITQKAFQESAIEVEKLRKEIVATFNEAKKFDQIASSGSLLKVDDIDTSKFTDLKSAMIAFGSSLEDGKLQFQGFNAAGTEMYGTFDRGSGVVENVTIAMRAGTNQLYAYRDGTKQVATSWQQLGGSLKKTAAQFATMYLSFHDIIRYIRQGVKYVKEIDLAMTELKKVTNETDKAYKNFLGSASEISNVIGSTVSDFTDATAAFARLGYSMSESTQMAETAIVYKNVADGLDSVEESTESIISTMKAYGIEANDTMGIIDRFNEVGNNFAITSAGIGEALQRSASALYEGGNTIDESIALVTAANSVIQNPEQVGELVAQQYSNILLENSYIG